MGGNDSASLGRESLEQLSRRAAQAGRFAVLYDPGGRHKIIVWLGKNSACFDPALARCRTRQP